MKKLYVASQNNSTRKWYIVGILEKYENGYKFSYTHGSKVLNKRFGSMISNITYSKDLFPFFKNRLLNKSRPEYFKFIKWLDSDQSDIDDMDILALTGGKRATDRIEIFMPPVNTDGKFITKFFARGVEYIHHYDKDSIDFLNTSERLFLALDVQNGDAANAILLRTDSPIFLLGYLPRFLASDISSLLSLVSPDIIKLTLLKENPDAPLSYRYLCKVEAPWPRGFVPCTGDEYLPLEE